ncbi:MAG TPA: hydrogenase formation protein HypD [Candidatus Thermoplasmatota archaeon]|nr:hydrogenase formation protein HypD [Candidatus Thermoplasmatota archaeon]
MFSLQDKQLAEDIVSRIKQEKVRLRFMHVCGTHQDTLMKSGLSTVLASCGITIGQGPGCPVCVTTPREIEEILLLARKGRTVATFGDMIRVPGATSSLQQLKADGCDVRTVYSIDDAVQVAEKNPSKEVVFMAVGFETTAPTTASVLLRDPPRNFSVLSCHRIIPPALQGLLQMGEIKIDGFIEPGHVSTIIGLQPYESLSRIYRIPQVVAGFEPLDLLMATWMLVRQVKAGDARVENEYARAVKPEGNPRAQQAIRKVFSKADVKWRGFPVLSNSGLFLKRTYETYDARKKYEDDLRGMKDQEYPEPVGCLCGEVLRGLISSRECPLFGKECTPDSPVGPCMVSVEGSCTIEYRYQGKQ